ncbi:MAG: NADPH-dependent F420 reductase [Armatimonadetes bacterium]|nr:NADPH-dependent F420 reductase [Armatimonadota bacterium]
MSSILGPVSILGGTGDLGRGLAARMGTAGLEVVIGSRDASRANEAAARIGLPGVRGAANADAVAAADTVVLAIPIEGHAAFVEGFAGLLSGKIVVDATVPLGPGFTFVPPPAGSAAAETQALVPGARVVAAFHTLSARMLADLTLPLDQDVLVCGDDPEARARVLELATTIGARGVDAGGLAAAATIEGIAVLLIGLNVRYKRRHLGIRIAHLPPDARPR